MVVSSQVITTILKFLAPFVCAYIILRIIRRVSIIAEKFYRNNSAYKPKKDDYKNKKNYNRAKRSYMFYKLGSWSRKDLLVITNGILRAAAIVIISLTIAGSIVAITDCSVTYYKNDKYLELFENMDHPITEEIKQAEDYNKSMRGYESWLKEGLAFKYINTEKMWAKFVLNIEQEADVIRNLAAQ